MKDNSLLDTFSSIFKNSSCCWQKGGKHLGEHKLKNLTEVVPQSLLNLLLFHSRVNRIDHPQQKV